MGKARTADCRCCTAGHTVTVKEERLPLSVHRVWGGHGLALDGLANPAGSGAALPGGSPGLYRHSSHV